MYYEQLKIISQEDTAYGVVVNAEVKHNDNIYCPYCKSIKLKRHKNNIITLRDIPQGIKPVVLQIKRIRYQCIDCKKTFTEKLAFVDERRITTYGCVKSIQHSAFKMPFVDVAKMHGVDEKTVRNIFNEYIGEVQAKLDRVLPEVMGIDEVYLGSECRCIITNLQDNYLFDLLETRKKDTLFKFCKEYQEQLSNVRIVCMDLWQPYKQMVQTNMPNAVIVADRFHVQRMATNAVEAARKFVRKQLTIKERLQLKDDTRLLLMNFERLDTKTMSRLYELLERFPLLNNIWWAKERFNILWNMETAKEAKSVYNSFMASLDIEAQPYFKDLITAMKNWETEIFNYFSYARISNATAETLNREVGRKFDVGDGYSFNALRNKLLFSPKGLTYDLGYSIRDATKMVNKGILLDKAQDILNDILRCDDTFKSKLLPNEVDE